MLEPFAELGFAIADGLLTAVAGDLLDTVEYDIDGLHHPKRLLRRNVQRAFNSLIRKAEGSIVIEPSGVAEKENGQKNAGKQH